MRELTFLKELILMKQVHQKGVIFLNEGFKFQIYVCNRCHDLLMMSINFSDIYISNIKNVDYCCTINWIIKSEAIKLLQNLDLTEKSRAL